jgi:hypothetical protein
MFKRIISILITLSLVLTLGASAFAKVYVHSYTRKNGTHVQAHYRTSPNHTKSDNWSTKGNVNPYTGKKGTK